MAVAPSVCCLCLCLVVGARASSHSVEQPSASYMFEYLLATLLVLLVSNCVMAGCLCMRSRDPAVHTCGSSFDFQTHAKKVVQRDIAISQETSKDHVFVAPTGTRFHLSAECPHLKKTMKVQKLGCCLDCSRLAKSM